MKPIFARLIAVLSFLLLGSLMLPVFHVQMQSDSRALEGGTILETDSEGIWRIDLASNTRTQYYRFPSDVRFQGYFIDFQEQYLYAVEVPNSTNWWQWQFGRFNLVKIDLLTGEKTVVYTGEDIGIGGQYPNSKDYILLNRYPHDYIRNRLNPEVCLLDLRTLNCQQVTDDAVGALFWSHFEVWLDYDTFTTGYQVVNIFSDDRLRNILWDKWIVYSVTHFHGDSKILVVAYPGEIIASEKTGANLYILDTTTFELSQKICEIPPFSWISLPLLSSDNLLVRYVWENDDTRTHGDTILDLDSCKTVMEPNGISMLSWLPGGHDFVGQRYYADNNPGAVVHVNADTGEVITLFETNERVSFTVVP